MVWESAVGLSSPKQFWHNGTLAADSRVQGYSPWLEGHGAKPPEAERVLFFGRPMEAANLLYSLYFAPQRIMYREIEGCDVNVSKSK